MADRPLCSVLMPFGVGHDPSSGREIDFDAVYRDGIRRAIEDAGMEPPRAPLRTGRRRAAAVPGDWCVISMPSL